MSEGYSDKLITLWCDFTFSAAHFLPNVPSGHKCKRMHGHNYKLRVEVEGQMQPLTGWVQDFETLRQRVAPFVALLDHNCLNDTFNNPTAEVLLLWFWNRIEGVEPLLSAIEVQEQDRSGVRLERQ